MPFNAIPFHRDVKAAGPKSNWNSNDIVVVKAEQSVVLQVIALLTRYSREVAFATRPLVVPDTLSSSSLAVIPSNIVIYQDHDPT